MDGPAQCGHGLISEIAEQDRQRRADDMRSERDNGDCRPRLDPGIWNEKGRGDKHCGNFRRNSLLALESLGAMRQAQAGIIRRGALVLDFDGGRSAGHAVPLPCQICDTDASGIRDTVRKEHCRDKGQKNSYRLGFHFSDGMALVLDWPIKTLPLSVHGNANWCRAWIFDPDQQCTAAQPPICLIPINRAHPHRGATASATALNRNGDARHLSAHSSASRTGPAGLRLARSPDECRRVFLELCPAMLATEIIGFPFVHRLARRRFFIHAHSAHRIGRHTVSFR